MQEEKIKEILEQPDLNTLKEVQSFLGKYRYYQFYIDHYLEKAEPLTVLIKKNQLFQQKESEKKSFKELKEMFYKGDMRKHFDPEILSEVNTDASDRAIAGVLQQRGETGKLMFVACYTRSLTSTE